MYRPGASVAGSKVPLCVFPFGSVQLPPASGVPPKLLNNADAPLLAQSVRVPFKPASGGGFNVMVTVDATLTHG